MCDDIIYYKRLMPTCMWCKINGFYITKANFYPPPICIF